MIVDTSVILIQRILEILMIFLWERFQRLAGSSQGYLDGVGNDAQFSFPFGICLDETTGDLFICDSDNHCIRKIDERGDVSTLVGGEAGYQDGKGNEAWFLFPFGICMDQETREMFVTDQDNHKIRGVTVEGVARTVAGSSTGWVDGEDAKFRYPAGICFDEERKCMYVCDQGNQRIRVVSNDGCYHNCWFL